MLYYQFAPLKSDYETIVISPSTLEKELAPKNPFVWEMETKKRAATFWTWNIVEDIVWTTVTQWRDAWYEKCKLWKSYVNPSRMMFQSSSWTVDNQFKWMFEWWLEQVVDLSMQYYGKDIYNLRSHNSLVEVDFSWYKVLVKWECDFWIDGEYLRDVKTAKKSRNEEEKWQFWCYQARFYSWMQFLAHPDIENITFSYIIFIKNKKLKLQNISRTLTREECETFVYDKLKEYLTRVHNWEIQTSEEALERL